MERTELLDAVTEAMLFLGRVRGASIEQRVADFLRSVLRVDPDVVAILEDPQFPRAWKVIA